MVYINKVCHVLGLPVSQSRQSMLAILWDTFSLFNIFFLSFFPLYSFIVICCPQLCRQRATYNTVHRCYLSPVQPPNGTISLQQVPNAHLFSLYHSPFLPPAMNKRFPCHFFSHFNVGLESPFDAKPSSEN